LAKLVEADDEANLRCAQPFCPGLCREEGDNAAEGDANAKVHGCEHTKCEPLAMPLLGVNNCVMAIDNYVEGAII
jgi:hypothetical protein